MASNDIQLIIEEKLGDVPATFIYAFLELVLVILLFLDGLISFAANEFAHFFGLKIPCLLCTRFEHVLFRRDPELFYKESICDMHRKEISSLAYCHVHTNLTNVQRMCSNCLLSFAAEKKSSAEAYRSLVAIFGAKLEISIERDHKIHLRFPVKEEEDQSDVKKRNANRCSCCGGPLRTWTSPDGCQVSEIPVHSFSLDKDSLMLKRKGSNYPFPLSNLSFVEQRIVSDAELDFVIDDNLSLTSEIDRDVDEVIGKTKFVEGLDGTLCEASATEQQGPSERSMWPGLDFKDGSFKHGLEEFTWDSDKCSLLAPEDYCKQAAVRAAPMLNRNNSDIKDAECIESNDPYKNAMANKLCRTNETTSTVASKTSDTPTHIALRKRLSIAIDKALDSSTESNMTEQNWKSLLQSLQRQVHLGRKSMIALSTELDQERNASAVAANQAMAMITRLQEEKAAVAMEALHYRRLMEEQVEYDREALQVMRDLLIRREKKIRDLEDEVETYRKRVQILVEREGKSEDYSSEMRWQETEDHKALSHTIDSS